MFVSNVLAELKFHEIDWTKIKKPWPQNKFEILFLNKIQVLLSFHSLEN